MFDSVVRPGAVVDRAILDKQVVVGPGAIVGEGIQLDRPNRLTPTHLNTGITIVGKQAVIPRGVRIGRNVRIDPNVRAADFAGRVVATGSTIERHDGQTRARAGRSARNAAGEETPVPGSRSGDAGL
jgi:glucose-1-phosphate adenylyltransferase